MNIRSKLAPNVNFNRLLDLSLNVTILVTLFLSQSWLKLPAAAPPFTATYILGFAIVVPLILTIILWGLTRFQGWRILLQSRLHVLWSITLIAFVLWAIFSQSWAFVAKNHAGVAQNAALQILLVSLFAFVVVCHPPPIKWLVVCGASMLVIQALIGGLQVAYQSSLGLQSLGELTLIPEKSGVSVIQAGDIRWLRPYGLLPHPNIYGGLVMIALFISSGLILRDERHQQIIGTILFLCGIWLLLLTFSRGAWLSFGIGVLVSLFFVLRFYRLQRRFMLMAGLSFVLAFAFIAIYRPFISSRVGASEESIEMRSVADRIVYNEIALDAIGKYPITGLGGGNFPWYASHYLYYRTNYDLRGDNVHQVILGIWSEYGLVGLALTGINILTAIVIMMRNIWMQEQNRADQIVILGSVMSLVIVGLIDHYPWTMIHIQILWFSLMALGISPPLTLKLDA